MTECRVAIVGAGSMSREHIRAYADAPDVELVGIHSRTRARAESLARDYCVSNVCDSVAELYERTQAHLVVVSVPETAMNRVSRACFEFPWVVFLEKPPGYNLPDAEEILGAATEKGRRVIVGLNRRFLSSTRAVVCDLAGNSGQRFIHVQDQQDRTQAAELGHPQAVVDNWMYANSIHLVDYLRLFGRGEVSSVTPVVRWSPETPRTVITKVAFDSGDIGLYEAIWDGPGPWAVSVTTPEKRWEMRPLEEAVFQARGERQLHGVEMHHWDRDFKPGFRLQAEMAIAAARGQPSESPTLSDVIGTMRLISDIYDH